MSRVSSKLRRVEGRYVHWCPGCEEMHQLPDSWTFDGNLEQPTFSPSLKHSGLRKVMVDGEWAGGWVRDVSGNPVPYVCHYILTAGQLHFCGDSTHALAGQTVPMPDLPGDTP